LIAVLESTSRLERLTDEIVSFVDRDDDVSAEQVDDRHDRPTVARVQRVDTRPPGLIETVQQALGSAGAED